MRKLASIGYWKDRLGWGGDWFDKVSTVAWLLGVVSWLLVVLYAIYLGATIAAVIIHRIG